MPTLESALGELVRVPQYFVWRLVWNAELGKYAKTPCAHDGSQWAIDASANENWSGYATVRDVVARLNSRVQGNLLRYALGFYLTADTGVFFLDLDKVPEQGPLADYAQRLIGMYSGALVERSSSGKGWHVIGRAHSIPERHRNKPLQEVAAQLAPLELELYSHGRGICFGLTGEAAGSADTVCDIVPLASQLFPSRAVNSAASGERRPEWSGPEDDEELIRRMLAARPSAAAAFGGKASLLQLWNGQADKDSHSDAALASHLAFWTGCDEGRIERLMRKSGLVRPKWDERRRGGTYLTYTIANACAACTAVYQERKATPPLPAPVVNVRSGAALMQRAFAPVQWALRGLIPQGTEILSAPPKSGKSWLVLQACIAVAAGVPLWPGREPETQGDTLYLDLEGADRRLQERITGLLHAFPRGTSLDRFFYETEWPRAEAGVAKLREWLTEHPRARLVVIDTLASFRDPDPGRKSAYMADYAVGEMLKPLVREFPVAIVIVTHTRKMAAGDAMDRISGTQGLVGGVDNYMVLSRASGNMDAELIVNGRDIKEPLELALRKLKDGGWVCVGNSYEIKRSDERSDVLKALASLGGVGTSRDIHAAMESPVALNTLHKRLGRMASAGEITKSGKLYTLVSMKDHELTPPPLPGREFTP